MGLKSVAFRDLLPQEITRLRGEAKLAVFRLWQPAGVAAASLAVLYLSYLIIGNGPETAGPRMIVGLAFMFVGLMVLPAVSVLKLWDTVKLWRALRSDLREGRVESFSDARSVANQPEFVSASALECPPTKSLEVLPQSRLVFLLDGAKPPQRMSATIYEAVEPPESVAQYALPKELASGIPTAVQDKAVFERRRLTPAELDELKQHVRRLRRPSGALVVFGIWCAVGSITAVLSYLDGDFSRWLGEHWIMFLGVAACTIWHLVRYVRTFLISRNFAQDTASGWVVVVQEKEGSQIKREVLPISSAIWSAEGKPTEWRFLQSRDKRARHKD